MYKMNFLKSFYFHFIKRKKNINAYLFILHFKQESLE